MNFKIGDKVKVLLTDGTDFNDESDYEVGVIKKISDDLGYFIEFDDNKFSSCYYDAIDLQKIENNNYVSYVSKDEIRKKILELKNKIPIKGQFVMYDCIKRNFQIEILEELLNEEGDPDAK